MPTRHDRLFAAAGSRNGLNLRSTDRQHVPSATTGTVRDFNSRVILNLVRKHEPVSRAELMRYSRLQRSTVSVITEQLIAGGWLKEGATGQLPRGRKPTFLHLNPERCGVVGVNIQPFSTTLAVAGTDGLLLAQDSIPTEKDPVKFIARLSDRIGDLMRVHPRIMYAGVGISLPGRVDPSSQQLIFAPTLGWDQLNLKTPLESQLGILVQLENAANACAFAELWSGRYLDEVHNLVAVTVSDEIDVGMIMNGQLVRGAHGLAGQFSHVPLLPGGPRCRCGNVGCWEALASNAAAVRYYTQSKSARTSRVGSRCDMVELSFSDILWLASHGDVQADRALNRMAHHLGSGIAMLGVGLAPDVLVIVGEVIRIWDKVRPAVTKALGRGSFSYASGRILTTDPVTQPQLHGAMALILQKYFHPQLIR
jgi:predicted NBD/HSP70 family sugar kinase